MTGLLLSFWKYVFSMSSTRFQNFLNLEYSIRATFEFIKLCIFLVINKNFLNFEYLIRSTFEFLKICIFFVINAVSEFSKFGIFDQRWASLVASATNGIFICFSPIWLKKFKKSTKKRQLIKTILDGMAFVGTAKSTRHMSSNIDLYNFRFFGFWTAKIC